MLNYITWAADPMLIDSFIKVRWYGVMFAIGFIVGYNIVAKIFKHEGAPESWLGILLMWTVAGTVIGARLGHVFFYEWDVYSQNPIKILYIWEGGLASHGGTLGVVLGVLLFSWITTHRSPMWTFDRLVVPVGLVAALIRFGNLMNSEIFGHPTDLPWGFMFVNSREWHAFYEGLPCHPTQLYEAFCYLIVFGIIMWMYWKKNAETRPGLIFGVFLVGIFLPRFLIEFVKNDQVAWESGLTLNMGQMLSIPFVLFGIFLAVRAMMRPPVDIKFPNKFAEELKK